MFLFSSKLSLGNLYIIHITNINDPFYLIVKCHLFSITMTSYFVTIVIVKLAITKYHIHWTSYILRKINLNEYVVLETNIINFKYIWLTLIITCHLGRLISLNEIETHGSKLLYHQYDQITSVQINGLTRLIVYFNELSEKCLIGVVRLNSRFKPSTRANKRLSPQLHAFYITS